MKVFALQTARAGSKSVIDKNILFIGGNPLYLYNVEAALGAQHISGIYVSTNCDTIKRDATKYHYKIIERPVSLCSDDASHHETIRHGLAQIEKKEGKIDCLVILLGNAKGSSSADLDLGIQTLLENDEIDSVMSVSEFNMFNPMRAYQQRNGVLRTIMSQETIHNCSILDNPNDKAAAGEILFFNGSFWICRKRAIMSDNGHLPFPWLGRTIKPFLQDVKMELDATWQIQFMER